ncbi:hypothetical protein ACGCUQ_05665 [Eubacteriales bacterium KG127]
MERLVSYESFLYLTAFVNKIAVSRKISAKLQAHVLSFTNLKACAFTVAIFMSWGILEDILFRCKIINNKSSQSNFQRGKIYFADAPTASLDSKNRQLVRFTKQSKR